MKGCIEAICKICQKAHEGKHQKICGQNLAGGRLQADAVGYQGCNENQRQQGVVSHGKGGLQVGKGQHQQADKQHYPDVCPPTPVPELITHGSIAHHRGG